MLRVTPVSAPLFDAAPSDWLAVYPPTLPLLMLGSERSPYTLLALAWDEVEAASVLTAPLPEPRQSAPVPWTVGILGLISYDDYDEGCTAQRSSRFFRIRRSLVLDHQRRRAFLCEDEGAAACAFQIPEPWTLPPAPTVPQPSLGAWIPSWSDENYLAHVEAILEDIRDGRFYQLNLLRYWQSEAAISRAQWSPLLKRWAGPFAACMDLPDLGLVSFSPERFFRIEHERGRSWLTTEPIKGTRAVSEDPQVDAARRLELEQHPKDRAELSMIVDLMRNDIAKVCRRGTVEVPDPGRVRSFANVHHLVARVRGELRGELRWSDLLMALCPGGSITGAPKREVMRAIREHEARDRGVFMGNLVYGDAYTGQTDSSILIRTALRAPDGRWQYAAGSGLVIHSDPLDEMAEVAAKARIVLELLGNS